MADFLTEMAGASKERARSLKSADSPRTDDIVPVRPLEIERSGFDLIAEAKLAGPATGRLLQPPNDDEAVVGLAHAYLEGGASVVSVLTEPTRFQGSLDHLRLVAEAVPLPVLRKDFLVDPDQIAESRSNGASGVLLIARILSSQQLVEMVETAGGMGMFSVVEIFGEEDLEVASSVFSLDVMVGVNSRDLTDLSVDRARLAHLRPLIPGHLTAVAESGLDTPASIQRVVEYGYRMALVGGALSSSSDPRTATARMVKSGLRAARTVAR